MDGKEQNIQIIITEQDSTIPLGSCGESRIRSILFDLSRWRNAFGEGTAVLTVKRHSDSAPYPVFLRQDGTRAEWVVIAQDTAQKGIGEAELVFLTEGRVSARKRFRTVVSAGNG